jgi:hypothetical protein
MTPSFTAFLEQTCVAQGSLFDVAEAVAVRSGRERPLLIFDDATGEAVDLDLRGGPTGAVAEYMARTSPAELGAAPRGRGRPRLGVVAREVTLLPRHWDWLAAQPGGASAALRRLVEVAGREAEGPDRERRAREAAYRVMSALAGDLPHYEEAIRALFGGDEARLAHLIESWPKDIAAYLSRLLRTEQTASPR